MSLNFFASQPIDNMKGTNLSSLTFIFKKISSASRSTLQSYLKGSQTVQSEIYKLSA